VEFIAPMLSSIPKVAAHASNESTMTDYYRFTQTILSLHSVEGFEADFDLRLNKLIVARLMGYLCGLPCMLIVRFGVE